MIKSVPSAIGTGIALLVCVTPSAYADDPILDRSSTTIAPRSFFDELSFRPLSLDVSPATGPATSPAEPDRRGIQPPLESPPFPGSDWSGPDPIIGSRDTIAPYPLEKLIKGTAIGDFLSRNRIRTYGWVDVGGNLSTSKKSNGPISYNLVPNGGILDQAVFRVERYLDTVQTDHMDWGFRVSAIYGSDYRYTTGKGYFDGQLLKHNQLYGADAPESYFLLYIPQVAEGMTVKVGRYISPADIEAQLAPQNYLYSHSMMFTFDPYTYTGVNATVMLSPQWTLEFGFHFGNDMAPWTNSAELNGLIMAQWKSLDGNDNVYGGLNAIGKGDYKNDHDDLQQLVGTWGHRFNDKWHMQTEAYWMWNFHALEGGTVVNGPPQPFQESVGEGARIKGRANEYGFVNYLEYKIGAGDYASFRNDILYDKDGQRSGFKTCYYSCTLGLSHAFTDTITFRPEVRYDHSFNAHAFDNGLRREQVTLSADLIFWF